jgi:hypothetical protein
MTELKTPQEQEEYSKALDEYNRQMDESVKQNPLPPEQLARLRELFKDE